VLIFLELEEILLLDEIMRGELDLKIYFHLLDEQDEGRNSEDFLLILKTFLVLLFEGDEGQKLHRIKNKKKKKKALI